MKLQGKKEKFSPLSHSEGHLRHAIIDFNTRRLFVSNGMMIVVKPLQWEELDQNDIVGQKMIHSEVLDLSKGRTTEIDYSKIHIRDLGDFPYAKPDVLDDIPQPIPDCGGLVDRHNGKTPFLSVAVNASYLKQLLSALGHSTVVLNFFKDEDRSEKMHKIVLENQIIVENLYKSDYDAAGMIMQTFVEPDTYEYTGFQNKISEDNIQLRVDVEAKKSDKKQRKLDIDGE